MTIANTKVVDTTSKYIVQSKGVKDETDQIVVDAEKLASGNNKSLVSLIECFYLIEGTGTLTLSASSEEKVTVAGMSDGTCDQLYLALRLASLENWTTEHT